MTVGRTIGVLREIHRHPVKSMAGESISQSPLAMRYGVVGDRAWAIRDVAAGEIRGAKKIPALLGLGARYVEEPHVEDSRRVEIALGDGTTIRSDDPGVASQLSARLGRPVELCPRLPAEAKVHYRRARPITDPESEIREASGLLPEESLPSMGEPPVDLSIVGEFVSPPGTYFDFFDLHLLSHQSLAHFAALVPDSVVEARRFRPNLVVELDGPGPGEPPWPELAWVGRVVAIGDARLELTMPMMRCGMTTQAQSGLPKDPRIMRALVRDCSMNLGVGVTVRRAGHVRVGDAIRLAED